MSTEVDEADEAGSSSMPTWHCCVCSKSILGNVFHFLRHLNSRSPLPGEGHVAKRADVCSENPRIGWCGRCGTFFDNKDQSNAGCICAQCAMAEMDGK